MRLSDYKEDLAKQESGSPYYLGDGCFYVKRINTSDYTKQIESIKKELYGFAPKEIDYNLILANWLAGYGITGWDGVLDEEDNELRYSKVNARKIFLNPEYFLGLNSLLIQHASSYVNYLHDDLTEDLEQIKKELNFRSEVGYGEEEAQIYQIYKDAGELHVFEEIKPKLTNRQSLLISAFYRLSQERRVQEQYPLPIIDRDIHYYQKNNGSCELAPDLFIIAIHAIDAEYIKRRCDELRTQASKG